MLGELCASLCYCWDSHSITQDNHTFDKESYQKVHETIVESFKMYPSDSNDSIDDDGCWSEDSLVIVEPTEVGKK